MLISPQSSVNYASVLRVHSAGRTLARSYLACMVILLLGTALSAFRGTLGDVLSVIPLIVFIVVGAGRYRGTRFNATLLRAESDGSWFILADGKWLAVQLLGGSTVISRLAVLRLRDQRCRRWLVVLRQCSNSVFEWRRLQVIWRHGALPLVPRWPTDRIRR